MAGVTRMYHYVQVYGNGKVEFVLSPTLPAPVIDSNREPNELVNSVRIVLPADVRLVVERTN